MTGLQVLLPRTPARTRRMLTTGIPSILHANAQLRSEAITIFYATTTFVFHAKDALASWLAELQTSWRTAIAHVCYVPRVVSVWNVDEKARPLLDEIVASLSHIARPLDAYNIRRPSSGYADFVIWPKGQKIVDTRPKVCTFYAGDSRARAATDLGRSFV